MNAVLHGSLYGRIRGTKKAKKWKPRSPTPSMRCWMRAFTIAFLIWAFLVSLCAEVVLENHAMIPFHNHANHQKHQNATMPALHFDSYPLPPIHQKPATVQVAASTSGCEAKFWVDFDLSRSKDTTVGDNHTTFKDGVSSLRGSTLQSRHRFLFKPATKWLVLNEWVAYKFALILGIERVPTVIPWTIDKTTIEAAIDKYEKDRQTESLFLASSLFSFEVKLKHKSWWVHTNDHSTSSSHGDNIVGTLQIFLSDDTVIQRGELDRWVTRYVTPSLHWSIVSPLAQREHDTRALFDTLLGNWDRYNNDFIMIPRGQSKTLHTQHPKYLHANGPSSQDERFLLYLDNNGLSPKTKLFRPRYCRFYANVVDRLRLIQHFLTRQRAAWPSDLAEIWLRLLLGEQNNTTLDFITITESKTQHANDAQVRTWVSNLGEQEDSIINARQFQPLKAMTSRLNQALYIVDGCVATYGIYHVYQEEDN